MFRPGLGSDAVQFQRHGVVVTVGTMPGDAPDRVQANFALRGLAVRIVPTTGPALPFHTASFDLAYLNALHAPGPPADELFRILRPGGKLFAFYPAKFGVEYWRNLARPWRRWLGGKAESPSQTATAAGLRQAFGHFEKHRINRRHLRRAGLPTAIKVVPHDFAERLLGEVIILRAFKPLRAATQPLARAA
jgi:SAM-dependent methyltransferase